MAKALKPRLGSQTLPVWTPHSDWVAPNLSELPSWEGQSHVGVDCEFKDPTISKLGLGARRGAKIAGYSFAFNDGRKYYIPVRHPEGNVDCQQGMAYMRHEAKHYKGTLVGANITTELDMFKHESTGAIEFPQLKCIKDVLVADPMIYELNLDGYSLEAVAERRGYNGKDEGMMKAFACAYGADVTKKTWKYIIPDLPAKAVGPYGEEDAYLPLKVLPVQERIMEEEGMTEGWNMACKVLPVLLKLRQRGVLIDWDQLDRVEAYARKQEKEALEEIYTITNVRICCGDTMKTGACVPAFAAVGINVPLTKDKKSCKMKYSIDAEFLSSIDHPVSKLLHKARKMAKIYSTFAKSIREHATGGRIHATFRQIIGANDKNEKSGAAFGRISSTNPNAQQQPSKGKIAEMWRAIYIPEKGKKWGCLDYSSQEPRWTVHFASLLGLRGGPEAAAEYRNNVKIDPHQQNADMTGLERPLAKQMVLAKAYAQGGAKTARSLGLSTRWIVRYRDSGSVEYFETKGQAQRARRDFDGEATYYEVAGVEAQKVIDTFDEKVAYVKLLSQAVEAKVKRTGILRLLGGRVLHFPTDAKGNYDFTYKGLNRLIQGTSGMQMQQAMIDIDEQMPDCFIQLQVHDELDGSFESIAEMKQAARIMSEAAGPTHVPFRIDIETGANWGVMKQVCGSGTCEHFVDKELVVNGTKETYYCPEHATCQ